MSDATKTYERLRYTGARKEAVKAAAKASYARNREARIAAASAWNKANPEKRRRTWLKSRYGITPEDYDEMLAEQSGRCGICAEHMSAPVVDHDHETGRVRGLLCRTCNAAIGQLRDDPELLRRAIEWVSL